MKLETFFKNFEFLVDAPNGVHKLRELILQLAVMGKLVPQDKNDESASVLLDKIKFEKALLIKQNKIKKIEKVQPIIEEELPYVLPNGWQWIRLGEVVASMTNGIYKSERYYSENGIGCLRMYNIHEGQINLTNLKRMIIDEWELQQYKLAHGDLLVNRVNSRELVGKSAVIDNFGESLIFESKNIRIRFLLCITFSKYINILFRTHGVRKIFEGYAKQTTGQASINQPQVANVLVPLPPLAEQKRIVAKVDELMEQCDRLFERQQKRRETRIIINNAAIGQLLTAREPEVFNKSWQNICNNFDLLYSTPDNIGKLRQAILQLAVQGKLVPQDENNEPASVLLKKIKLEKERLVKEGKIKKEKSLPAINFDKIPYEIPQGWEWIQLGEIVKRLNMVLPKNHLILLMKFRFSE